MVTRPVLLPYFAGRTGLARGTVLVLVPLTMGRAGRRIFPPRLRRGTRHPDAPPSPRSASESVRADTLRAHTENAAAPAQYPSAERRYRPNVTSGCPKRSEGGCPCRNEDEYRFSKRNRASRVEANKGSEPSGPPPAKTCPNRPAHPEERAGRRHRSSPRRARVRRLHAHRWRLRG